jgi:hypothetical protein
LRTESRTFFHFLVDICLPGFLTYMGVTTLSAALEQYHFFVVHTTTAKLIYIMTGLFVFSIGYALRRFIIVMGFLAIVCFILFGMSVDFFRWLKA